MVGGSSQSLPLKESVKLQIGGPGSGEKLYPISFAAARTSEMMLSRSASVVR